MVSGENLIERGDCPPCPSWGVKGDINKASEMLRVGKAALAAAEAPVEAAVSAYLGRLPSLWLLIDDEPGPGSLRGPIERNAIALTSGLQEPVIDQPSPSWLGLFRAGTRFGALACRTNGLWTRNTCLTFLTCWKRLSNATRS